MLQQQQRRVAIKRRRNSKDHAECCSKGNRLKHHRGQHSENALSVAAEQLDCIQCHLRRRFGCVQDDCCTLFAVSSPYIDTGTKEARTSQLICFEKCMQHSA